jgi:hypothetical protein
MDLWHLAARWHQIANEIRLDQIGRFNAQDMWIVRSIGTFAQAEIRLAVFLFTVLTTYCRV